MSLLLNARIARDLTIESGLSEPDCDVLSALTESPDARCRISELADYMPLAEITNKVVEPLRDNPQRPA